jgi:hypothetical protein
LVVGQATNNGGEAHRTNNGGGKSFMVVGQANNNGNPKPDSGGRHINRTLGEENRLELLVRQTTTEIQSPTPAGGILIDHWARKIVHGFWSGDQQRRRKIIHSCWSGDPPEADKSNNGGEADKFRPDSVGTNKCQQRRRFSCP